MGLLDPGSGLIDPCLLHVVFYAGQAVQAELGIDDLPGELARALFWV